VFVRWYGLSLSRGYVRFVSFKHCFMGWGLTSIGLSVHHGHGEWFVRSVQNIWRHMVSFGPFWSVARNIWTFHDIYSVVNYVIPKTEAT
jgi:hypothetical protein